MTDHQFEPEQRPEQYPIAIIGIGCRFPGATGPEGFWQLIKNSGDVITEIPSNRFDINLFYDDKPSAGRINSRWGGFLDQIDQFDPYFFGISPREAVGMDPQQRILLEVAWEALEDAGQVPEQLVGSPTGVFLGMITNDYENLQFRYPENIDIYIVTGGVRSVASGRVSYVLGLQGSSLTVDTACSSSLVAVHLACQSLRTKECSLALAGGANLVLLPEPSFGFSLAGMLSPEGHCKFGDVEGNGFVRSDGFGMVVLKPLSAALADKDPIYAVILGSAVNNDGRSSGLLMSPGSPGQEAALRAAYRNAGVSPSHVQYIEAHGTGTSVGDPAEMEALGNLFAEYPPESEVCYVGSVKTNIGHTEATAGVAGLIKTALSLKHKVIPPSLHFHQPNPKIPWDKLPLVIPQELTPWPETVKPARAGVSSFGISGTNAHVVLEEAPEITWVSEDVSTSAPRAHLLPLSAHSPEALEAMVKSYREFINSWGEHAPSLHDLCYTASARRAHHDQRLALVFHSADELVDQLEAFLEGEVRKGMSAGQRVPGQAHKVVFVFPGHGSQWFGMGRELLEQEPVFRARLEQCDAALRQEVDWSLLEELTSDEAHSHLNELDIIQPILFSMQVALSSLWRSWGIEPDAVIGQSMGEVGAAYIAEAITLDDALRIICRRSRLLKRLSGKGSMAVVELSQEEAQLALAGYEDRLSIAVGSSPTSTVLAGDPNAMEELLETLQSKDIFCRPVKGADVASHSPQMESLRGELLQALEGIQPLSPTLPIYSTVLGSNSNGLSFDANYWWRNLREPVRFSNTIQKLLEDGHHIFIEMSPHPIVLTAIQQVLHHLGQEGAALPSLRREEEERAVMLSSLGSIYTAGHKIDWSRLYPSGGQCIPLPLYQYQREHLWVESDENDETRNGKPTRSRSIGTSGHPLLGPHLISAVQNETHHWEMDLSPDLHSYLKDHRVQDEIVLPTAAYVEIALAAAAEAFGPEPFVLKRVKLEKALFLPEDGERRVQLVISSEMPGTASFKFYSYQTGNTSERSTWTLHVFGIVSRDQARTESMGTIHSAPAEIQGRCSELISGLDHYEGMTARGLQYGPLFQGVKQIWRREGEALGELLLPDALKQEAGAYQVHPALLDACLQVLAATLPGENGGVGKKMTYLPVRLDTVRVSKRPETNVWSHALLRPNAGGDASTFQGDVFLIDSEGEVLLQAEGIRLQHLGVNAQAASKKLYDWHYEIEWQPSPRPLQDEGQRTTPEPPRRWLILTDNHGVGESLQSLLEAHGDTCIAVSLGDSFERSEAGRYQVNPNNLEHFRQLLKHACADGQPPVDAVVHLWSLEAAPPEDLTHVSLKAAHDLNCSSVLHLIQSLSEVGVAESFRLWLVTRGAQAVSPEDKSIAVAQSPLWGLSRVISYEHPELHCARVDLASDDRGDEIEALLQELKSPGLEDQIAFRGNGRYVPRLVKRTAKGLQESSTAASNQVKLIVSEQVSYQLEITTPGILDSLQLHSAKRRPPGPNEVEIRVHTTGLIFRDVILAMGLLPSPWENEIPLGWECVGTVVSLGEGVRDFHIGDEVIAIAPPCFSAYATTHSALVVPKPANLSMEEAATIPASFLTAYYALEYMARLREGERVLIHSAAGGVGLAALQIARRLGAEIFATVSTSEKREFLKSLGVQHIFDSRSLVFADEVLERTGGKGVDVVLNSLAGDAIPKTLSILAPYGRFLEIGKSDIYRNSQLGLRPFEKNLSYFAIDLDRMLRERPAFVGALLREFIPDFAAGSLKPLPYRAFGIEEAVDAFRFMTHGKHIGKILVTSQEQVLAVPACKVPFGIRSDSTYLITGGLGGLGLVVAKWMIEQGARHLALMGRSAPSASVEESLERMRRAGVQITVVRADVANPEQVAKALADINESMPQLKGIVHAAAILDDGILLQIDRERLHGVLAAKASGAWNLHLLTRNTPLDFFVLFSSAASVLGSPGQGNYSAANAFLDALAHHRRAQGLPALSINWGPWGEAGLAARPDRGGRLAKRGLESMSPEEGVEVLKRVVHLDSAQAGAMRFDVRQWFQFYPAISNCPFFAQLATEKTSVDSATESAKGAGILTSEALLSAEESERQQLLEAHLLQRVAKVLKFSASKLDPRQPLNKMGIDSLMAVELKNRIDADFGVAIPVVTFLKGSSVSQLATMVLERLMDSAPRVAFAAAGAQGAEFAAHQQWEEGAL